MVLFPPPFYFVFDISNLLSYIQNISSNELAPPVMGTIFLVNIAYYTSKSGIWRDISRVASYFHEPKASANTAYE